MHDLEWFHLDLIGEKKSEDGGKEKVETLPVCMKPVADVMDITYCY
jgi:hypothetical protein